MKRIASSAVLAGALALACGQSAQASDFVKYRPGPPVEVATAQCKAYAAKAAHVVVGVGSIEAAAFGLLATLVATAARRAMIFDHCMSAQGYLKAGSKALADAQAAQAAKAQPAAKAVQARTVPAKAATGKTPVARTPAVKSAPKRVAG